MKKLIAMLFAILMVCSLAGCGGKQIVPDYSDAASFEAALNNGEDLTGKTVQFKVDELVPDSAFGYNIQAGEHLNFCSSSNPKVSVGDIITVKVDAVESMLGSYIISYTIK